LQIKSRTVQSDELQQHVPRIIMSSSRAVLGSHSRSPSEECDKKLFQDWSNSVSVFGLILDLMQYYEAGLELTMSNSDQTDKFVREGDVHAYCISTPQ
jgi:hypothetical protein